LIYSRSEEGQGNLQAGIGYAGRADNEVPTCIGIDAENFESLLILASTAGLRLSAYDIKGVPSRQAGKDPRVHGKTITTSRQKRTPPGGNVFGRSSCPKLESPDGIVGGNYQPIVEHRNM
jgi:hypothetical protein